MSAFIKLPSETLIQIINETSAGDITSLASSCLHLHLLSQKRLKFHKSKRAEAEDIVVGSFAWDYPQRHPSQYLQNILEDKDIRFYTKAMQIGFLGPGSPDNDEGGFEDEDYLLVIEKDKIITNAESQHGRQISALVASVYSALLPHAAKTDVKKWTEKILCGEPEAVVILLLALYPNLETLHIHEAGQRCFQEKVNLIESMWKTLSTGKRPTWGNIFRSLTATAMAPATNRMKIFSKLSEIILMGAEDPECRPARAEMITPFQALPTMRRVLGRDIEGCYVRWPYSIGISQVTDISFKGDIDKISLSNLICGLRALKGFSYTFSPSSPPRDLALMEPRGKHLNRLKWGPYSDNDTAKNHLEDHNSDGDDPDEGSSGEVDARRFSWEPRSITASLMQYARQSLVSMKLTATSIAGLLKLSRNELFIGSLRSFEALTSVCLETVLLFERVQSAKKASLVQQPPREGIKAQRLVDFLPQTIERFTMTCYCGGKSLSKDDVAEMFTGLPKLRSRLPKLSDIRFKQRQSVYIPVRIEEGWKDMSVRCAETGIKFHHELVECTDRYSKAQKIFVG